MRELAFVSADPHGKPRVSDRKLIRSHCMKEKNRKIGVRKVDPARSNARAAIASSHPIRDGQKTGTQQPSRRSRSGESPDLGRIEISCTEYRPSQLEAALAAFAYKVDSAALELLQRFLTTFNKTVTHRFQDCVSFEPHQTVNTTWLLEDEAYLHSVLLVASAMWEDQRSAGPRGGGGLRSQSSTRTGLYMSKTLASLREGLSATSPSKDGDHHTSVVDSPNADGDADQAARLSSLRDSRISVVATLVILSTLVGDTRALKAHVAGLVQMVRLRGGLGGIRNTNPSLYAKIRRVDVLWSLYSGERPLFLSPQDHESPSSSPNEPPQRRLFCRVFGSSHVSPPLTTASTSPPSPTNNLPHTQHRAVHGPPLAEAEFRSLVSESQCDLVALRERCSTIPAECLRLALLVVLTTTMNLPSPAPRDDGVLPPTTIEDEAATEEEGLPQSTSSERYPDLSRKFETCIRSLEISSSHSHRTSSSSPQEFNDAPRDPRNENDDDDDDDEYPDLEPDLILWLLLVGAVSLYGVDSAWLRELWRYHVTPRHLTSWDDEVAPRLRRRWVWADAVHDGLGRHAFEVLTFGWRQTVTAAERPGGHDGADRLGVVDGPRGILWASGWAICPFRL
ncbi:hypothetical protein PG988_002213 [Apiospora saccharicola]